MKIESLNTNVTAIGSPTGAETEIFWAILGIFSRLGLLLRWGSHFVTRKPPFEDWKPYLGPFDENRVVGNQCNSCRIPWQSRTCYFGEWFWLGVFLANTGHFCGRWATLWCRNLLLSFNNSTWGHFVKIEWLVADVIAVGILDRAERAVFEVIVAGCVFGQSRSFLWSGSHFVV